MRHATLREIRVGLVIVAALAAIGSLLFVASGGPGFLTARRSIDVIFRDAQGARAGSSVRIAGMEVGRVDDVVLTEHQGALGALVRISIPKDLAAKLRQDVKITIQASLTGQSNVNIISSGRSSVPLVAGQLVTGVETSVFDPILEQVGLGPDERKDLSHTISTLRQTVDVAAPRLRLILDHASAAVANVRETTESIRPAAEDIARKLEAAGPRIDATLTSLNRVSAQADALLAENRPNLKSILASAQDLSATLRDIVAKDREKIDKLLDGFETIRIRTDHVMYNAEVLSGTGVQMLIRNRAAIDRTIANVRDATDWADQLIQKIYSNPFVISPFYKPNQEDIRTQTVADTARVFVKGARELSDLVKTLETLQASASNPEQKKEFEQLYKKAWMLTDLLGQTEKQLAEGLRPRTRRGAVRE